MKLDRIDVGILQAMQRDAHAKAVDLAEALGISPSPLYRRIRLLEQAGVITHYVTLLDQEKVGLPVSAYISVALEKSAEKIAAFERNSELRGSDGVLPDDRRLRLRSARGGQRHDGH